MNDIERIHVYPNNDSLEHNTDGGPCWCNPVSENVYRTDAYGVETLCGVVITHTAADGRTNQDRQFLSGAN